MPAAAVVVVCVPITMPDAVRLAALEDLHPHTVKRVYAGRPCEASTYRRIERGARTLGLPPPPPRSQTSRPELELEVKP